MGEGRPEPIEAEIRRDRAMFQSLANHDLQGPLRTLRGFVELAAEEHPSALLDEAATLAARLQGLVRAALGFARMLDHPVQLRPLDLGAAVRDALARAAVELHTRGAVVDVAPDLPPVRADAALLAHALDALVDNAARYTRPEQPPRIRIDAHADGPTVRLRITDAGPGLAPADRVRAFDPLVRLNGEPGHGLGLAIVRRAAALHGGDCGLEDAPDGVGLRAWITLPAARSPDGP